MMTIVMMMMTYSGWVDKAVLLIRSLSLAYPNLSHPTLFYDQVERTQTERTILANVRHPFIVCLHFAFQSPQKLYMVMDFVQVRYRTVTSNAMH